MAVGCASMAFGDIVCNPAGRGHSQAVLGTLGRQTLGGPSHPTWMTLILTPENAWRLQGSAGCSWILTQS